MGKTGVRREGSLRLMAHQETGAAFLRSHPRAALLDDPGLGKSAQALLAAKEPVLIVAPAMVLNGGVWDDEIERWAPGIEATQVSYSRLFEREGRKSTTKLHRDLRRQWGTVVADEAHYLKGRKTFWTQAFHSIRMDRLHQLTGTPLPNWAHEAYVPLKLLWPEQSRPGGRYGSYWRWVKEWFDVGQLRGKGGRIITEWHIGGLRKDRTWDQFREENWGDRALRRLREDCLDLPPLTEQWIRIELTGEQKRVYKDLYKDFVAWLDSGEEIVAWNEAARFVKCSQAATQVGGKGAKLSALSELLTDRGRPTLVVAHYRCSVEAAAEAARAAGKQAAVVHGGVLDTARGQFVREFQRGELPVLCATINTISEGLTLNAADQIIFLERSYTPSRNEQAMRRIHRIGQNRPVSAIHLVAEDTVEERIIRLLKAKTDAQLSALPREEINAWLCAH